jgi:hypothetical protein
VDYEVAEVTAAATFYMADLYLGFGRALRESERPADLDPGEVQDYEAALEAEAQPLEAKAVEVHQKNLELLGSGVYNAWIEKSLAELAELVPARYSRPEASSGFIESIDAYAYQLPSAPAVVEIAPPASAAPEGDDAEPR